MYGSCALLLIQRRYHNNRVRMKHTVHETLYHELRAERTEQLFIPNVKNSDDMMLENYL